MQSPLPASYFQHLGARGDVPVLQERQAVEGLGVLDVEVGGVVQGDTGDRGGVEF